MNYTKKLISGLIILLAVTGTGLIFKTEVKDFFNKVSDNPVIVFPDIKSRTLIKNDFDSRNVALEISQFIVSGAEKNMLWNLAYAGVDSDSAMGIELTYELNQTDYNLTGFYKEIADIIKNRGWRLLALNIGDSQMFLDIKRDSATAVYKVRISAEQNGGLLSVKAQYLITPN